MQAAKADLITTGPAPADHEWPDGELIASYRDYHREVRLYRNVRMYLDPAGTRTLAVWDNSSHNGPTWFESDYKDDDGIDSRCEAWNEFAELIRGDLWKRKAPKGFPA